MCTGFVPGNPFKMGAAAHAVVGEELALSRDVTIDPYACMA